MRSANSIIIISIIYSTFRFVCDMRSSLIRPTAAESSALWSVPVHSVIIVAYASDYYVHTTCICKPSSGQDMAQDSKHTGFCLDAAPHMNTPLPHSPVLCYSYHFPLAMPLGRSEQQKTAHSAHVTLRPEWVCTKTARNELHNDAQTTLVDFVRRS